MKHIVKLIKNRRHFEILWDIWILEWDTTFLFGYLEQICNFICIAYIMKHESNEPRFALPEEVFQKNDHVSPKE